MWGCDEEIIRIIAKKRYGIERTEILKKAKLSTDGGTFKKRLRELKHAGFISEFIPYGTSTKRGLYYRIIDEFTLFYLSWVEPKLKVIESLPEASKLWNELCASAAWKSWSGYAFEAVCHKHVHQIREALNLSVLSEIAHWSYTPKDKHETGAQIDLLFDRPDNAITLCEIKCTQKPFKLTKEYAKQLMQKMQIFAAQTGTQKSLHLALITIDPIKETIHSEGIIDAQITLLSMMK